MVEETKQIPTYSLGDTIRIELEVSDSSGVAEVATRFRLESGKTSRSIYWTTDGGGETSTTVAIEQEVTDGMAPGEYKCEYVSLTDLRGNSTLVVNPDISFRIEGIPGDHEGPKLGGVRFA